MKSSILNADERFKFRFDLASIVMFLVTSKSRFGSPRLRDGLSVN